MEQEHKTISVSVNKHPVALSKREVTGMEIKTAAIDQGVKIKPDFVLMKIKKDGEFERIGDDQKIEVHDGEEFRAVTPEDVS